MPNSSFVILSDISDHFSRITNYSVSGLPSVHPTPCNLSIHYQHHQLEHYKFRLSAASWEFLTDSSWSVDNLFNKFYDLVEAFVDSCYATSVSKRSKLSVPCAPWMTTALLKNTKRKTYLLKAFKSSNSHHHLEKYKKYRNLWNSLIRKARYIYYSQMFSEFGKQLRTTWQFINTVLHPNSKRNNLNNKIIPKGAVITNSRVIMDEFCSYFASIRKSISEDVLISASSTSDFKKYPWPSCEKSKALIPFLIF